MLGITPCKNIRFWEVSRQGQENFVSLLNDHYQECLSLKKYAYNATVLKYT